MEAAKRAISSLSRGVSQPTNGSDLSTPFESLLPESHSPPKILEVNDTQVTKVFRAADSGPVHQSDPSEVEWKSKVRAWEMKHIQQDLWEKSMKV